jgi:hypothetical protein
MEVIELSRRQDAHESQGNHFVCRRFGRYLRIKLHRLKNGRYLLQMTLPGIPPI